MEAILTDYLEGMNTDPAELSRLEGRINTLTRPLCLFILRT